MEYKIRLDSLLTQKAFQPAWRNGVVMRATNWLGDALMTLPASYQLSQLKPSPCGFFVLSPRGLAPLWRACPWVDVVIEMADKRISGEEVAEVKALHAGVGVVFPNSFGAAWDMFRCGVPMRLGRRGRWRRLLLTDTLPEWPRVTAAADFHQLSYYFDLVSALGQIERTTDYPDLKVDGSLAAKLQIIGDGWICLAPGAAYGPAKQWPKESFLAVGGWALSQGYHVVLVGGGKEREVCGWIHEHLPASLDLSGQTDLAQLMSVLRSCRGVVANDSGVMHLSAAVGTPGVAIFGSTDPVGTGPIGATWRLLVSGEHCRPCFKRECPLGDYRCLRGITSDQVLGELQVVLR